MIIQYANEGRLEKRRKERRVETVHWKETEPLDVLYTVPMGSPQREPGRKSQTGGFFRRKRREGSMKQLVVWASRVGSYNMGVNVHTKTKEG